MHNAYIYLLVVLLVPLTHPYVSYKAGNSNFQISSQRVSIVNTNYLNGSQPPKKEDVQSSP